MRFTTVSATRRLRQAEEGFTLIELMVVVAIAAVCMATVVMVNPQFIRAAKADSGVSQAMEILRTARETAISQRRNVQVQFVGNNTIQIAREDIDANGIVTGTTVLRSARLEGRMRFMLTTGVPDTPDLFGRTAPASFSSATRRFSSEGTFINGNGDPMNGTLFLGNPEGDATAARAITFFGPTALMRLWRWDGRKWVE
jgi:prepilin-type N-terminal cleavage/methylation domain-containing protein